MKRALFLFLLLGGCADYYPHSSYGDYGAPTYYYYRAPQHYRHGWRYYQGYDRPWLHQRHHYHRY